MPLQCIVLRLFISKHLYMSNVKGECNSPLQRIINHFNIELYTITRLTDYTIHRFLSFTVFCSLKCCIKIPSKLYKPSVLFAKFSATNNTPLPKASLEIDS